MTEIGRRNNWDVEWKVGEFQALWGMVDNNSITTIAADVNSTPEREEKYYFTKPYSAFHGTADALLASVKLAYSINDQLGVPVEIFNPEYRKHALCYPFKKPPENEKLIEQFNKTLDEMLKDGTVASYSKKWLKLEVTKFKKITRENKPYSYYKV